MKRKLLLTALALTLVLFAGTAFAAYPDKPVKVVNYVGPGGLMDVTSRKFVSIAKKFTDATFVVDAAAASNL